MVKNIVTEDILSFVSIRETAEYIGIYHSLIAKSIQSKKFYLGRDYLVYKSYTLVPPYSPTSWGVGGKNEEEIMNSEVYKEAVDIIKGIRLKTKHTESSKELIRKANKGKKYSQDIIKKLSLNSKNAKVVLITNNDTLETMEFPSAVSAGRYLGVDESYVRRCITNNKSCKGFTLTRKTED